MTTNYDDLRHRIGVLRGGQLSVKVPADVIPEVNDAHSFRTISEREGEDGVVTVTLEEGFTRLEVHGVTAVFDGYRYFPRDPDTVDYDLRGDVGDAKVGFESDDGHAPLTEDVQTMHPVRNMTVHSLVNGFERGNVEPLPKRND